MLISALVRDLITCWLHLYASLDGFDPGVVFLQLQFQIHARPLYMYCTLLVLFHKYQIPEICH